MAAAVAPLWYTTILFRGGQRSPLVTAVLAGARQLADHAGSAGDGHQHRLGRPSAADRFGG